MSSIPPEITSARLLLRLPAAGDARALADYFARNRAFHQPWMPLRTEAAFSAAHWEDRIPQIRADYLERGTGMMLLIWDRRSPDRVIGKVSYSQFTRGPAQFCFLGYDLAEDSQGAGIMTEALESANTYVFANLRLHRIMANYMPRNERSGRLLRRLGFVVEGYARDYLLINGRWEDHILTSLVNPMWEAV